MFGVEEGQRRKRERVGHHLHRGSGRECERKGNRELHHGAEEAVLTSWSCEEFVKVPDTAYCSGRLWAPRSNTNADWPKLLACPVWNSNSNS